MARKFKDSISYPPRGMRRETAASYVGLSPIKFDELVADGRMPKPARVDGCVIWDRYKLDAAFDDLANDDNKISGWDLAQKDKRSDR
jgi:predicted DNA-binding transcriptional regulator AlpA